MRLGNFKNIHAGEEMNWADFPLRFVDGSVLMIAQTLRPLGNRKLELIQSIFVFVKVVEGRAQYVFHYDKVVDIPNHPDNHLQIEFDKSVNTPRFDKYKFVELEEIIGMIIRDGLIMN
ncbi:MULTISPECIES: hypothetical protein [Paenibacillus]|uniref:hypothetical protein n=1 Tax=Paenibacillus TaxID=44249 RepID=UPI00096C8CFE|nr:hypothetical protein [Paenibacillus odorifer]OMD18495.1 hypothetical protein BJP50_14290 [Paenibacillus odorifer]